MSHIMEYADKLGIDPDLPKGPADGDRTIVALIAHDEPVVIPPDASEKVHEGGRIVVTGKKAKHLDKHEALSCVLGYTIGSDVSERTWQGSDRSLWRPKNTDAFKPMRPWIETFADFDHMETITCLNRSESTRFATNSMRFGIDTFIAAMTCYLTHYPGDVVWMGADGRSPDLEAGDVVELEISGIGMLRNPFTAGA
jgi:2-keto-4-pentenoate hydratase/2-oxohepta-3-ene-1,7-dioic acid hydratase in catechol pathway